MERVLDVYARPYNPKRPVICLDERPCFLIGDVLCPIPVEPGKAAKEDYMYEKFGSCCVLLAIEPLTGRRFVRVVEHRTAEEYAKFLQEIEKGYPEVEQITIVQDNLNTHHGSSFYKVAPPEEANRMDKRFEWIFTPKHASWLNMAELEFSALSRQCLNRRIAKREVLEVEVNTWVAERNRLDIKLNWQFSTETARTKFSKHYDSVKIN